jgi:hypothetical protein
MWRIQKPQYMQTSLSYGDAYSDIKLVIRAAFAEKTQNR